MRGRKSNPGSVLLLLGITTLLAACADNPVSDVEIELSSVELDPNQVVVDAGGSAVVTAYVTDRNGNRIMASQPDYTVLWSTSDPSVLRVDGDGPTATVIGESGGSAELSAEIYVQGDAKPVRRQVPVTSRAAVSSLKITGGNGQSGPVGTLLPQKITVQAIDQKGYAARGAVVRFAVTAGNGTVSSTEVVTDDFGMASSGWTLGPQVGVNRASASAEGVTTVGFEALATAPITQLEAVEGNGQNGTAGQTLPNQLGVRVLDSTLKPLSGVTVTWTVATGGGQVTPTSSTDAAGVARASWTLGPNSGTQVVRAAAGSKSAEFVATAGAASVDVIIKAAGDAQTGVAGTWLVDSLVVRVLNGAGSPRAGVAVNWSIVTGGGSVSPATSTTDASGYARTAWQLGPTAGSATVRAAAANVGEVVFSATIQSEGASPTPPPVGSLLLTPQSVTLDALGAQSTLTATTYDVNGQVVTGQTINWTSSNPMIASVDNAGRITAKAVGTALIVASALCCDKADTTAVNVRQELSSVAVQPKTASVGVGAQVLLQAAGKDANGFVIPSTVIAWSTANTNVATVNAQGVVTGVTAGTAVVRATSGAFSDSSVVTVTASPTPSPTPVLTTITLTPSSASMVTGTTQTFTATAYDQNGSVMTGVAITWTSSNTSVMTVSQGVVTALAVGIATVRATSGSVSGSAQVTVSAPAPPPPPGSYSPPDIAFADMENGTTTPFTTASGGTTGNADIVIMNDPTGAFGGKLARIRYARQDVAASADVNRALRYSHSTGIGLGQTVFMRGHVFIPTPAANMVGAQRKLFYVQRQTNDISFVFLKAESSITGGQHLKVELTKNVVFNAGSIPFNRKVSIEMQITTNTAVGRADGVIRLWVDGVLALDKSGIEWLTSTAPFKVFLFGQQTQHLYNDLSVLFDEYRYWDNMALSTKRIGP